MKSGGSMGDGGTGGLEAANTGPEVAPGDAAEHAWGTLSEKAPTDPGEVENFVARLVGSMTQAEKLATMSGDGPLIAGTRAMSKRYNGEPIVGGAIERLGLPGIRFTDGPRGVVMYHSTAFPTPMARAATFDPGLEERIGEVIGIEARAQGANLFAGVCVNLLRHPAWGRAQETYGEDPWLLGEMGAALVRGTQRHVMACVKHFALNSMENSRLWLDVRVDSRDLRDLYLPHFRRCIDEGVVGVMSAYNKVDGQPCGHNHRLLTEILKGDWGFDGLVMSDFTWGIRSARAAALGGMDLEMPFRWRFRRLGRLVASGKVPQSRIEDAATRLVRAQVRFATRGRPEGYPLEAVACAGHRALAREASARSVVLLQNRPVPQDAGEAPPLPIDPSRVGSLAVIGWLAGRKNIGDKGSSQVRPPSVVTLRDGIVAAAEAEGIEARFDDGTDLAAAARVAQEVDLVILVAGSSHKDEGEWILTAGGDRKSLRLSPHDEALIAAVGEANSRTVVVLMGGSAFVVDGWRDQVAALAMCWYPGMEGGHGVADVLFGRAIPEGRLPSTWPARRNRLPEFRRFAWRIRYGPLFGYRLMHAESQRPAYWFGFGLGYSDVVWGPPVLDHYERNGEGVGMAALSIPVTNSGTHRAVEVVQAYVDQVLGSHPDPLPALSAVGRINLRPGEAGTVQLAVPVPEGASRLRVGRSANPDQLIDVALPG